MSYIFLSHSSVDELEAVALKQWLLDNGWDDIFLDLDPERGLRAGVRWQEALRRAADRCEAVIFIISPAWAKSKWCLTEFLLAKSLNKLIFGVVMKETALSELPTELTAEYQLTHLIGKGSTETIHFVHHEQPAEIEFLANGLGRLRLGLQTAGLSASFFPWPPEDDKLRAPYRGLEPLDAKDAAVFFGRDAEILQGLDRLRGMRASGDEGLFVILGPSGSGKSSFLRAGLLPRLARNSRHFHALEIIRPERSPLYGERGLAHAISRANQYFRLMPANLGEVKTALGDGAERLDQLLRNIQDAARHQLLGLPEDAPPPTLVLPVDQAEELFSADATDEARRFLDLIGGVLRGSLPGGGGLRLPLIIAFTIRSDRYEPLQTAPELTGLKTVVFDALKPMPRVQFKEVITGPAIRATSSAKRLEVKPDLVQQLLADCEQGGDTLPLLSLTLSRLYRDYSSDGDLRLDEYQAMGGMSNVIRTETESILASDPDTRKAQLDTLHAAFIPWLATINPDNDKPMRRVARMADLPPESHGLVQGLIEKRLLLSDMRNGEQVVEVAHETLLRQWKELAKWLEQEGDDLKEADRLEHASIAWNGSGKKPDWLMEGERLMAAGKLAAKPGYHRRLETTAEFLLCSRQREAQRKEAEERQRRTELLAAQEKQAAAEEQQRITAQLAEAERKKGEVELLAARDREAAAEALAAEQLQATERAQADSDRLKKQAKQLFVAALGAVVFAIGAGYGFINATTEKNRAEVAKRESNGLRLIAESQAMIRGRYPGGEERAMLQMLAVKETTPSKQADEAILDTLARRYDTHKIWMAGSKIRAVAFSPKGEYIVSANVDKTVRLWNAQSGKPLGFPMRGHRGSVLSVAFSPDGARIASGSWDKTIRLWNAQTREPIGAPIFGHQREVMSVAFSPDGNQLVSGSWDTTLCLWDIRHSKPTCLPLKGHTREVMSVAFNREGTLIVSGSGDATIRLWDAETGAPKGEPMKGHEDGVTSVAFTPDGEHIVSGSRDKTLRIWSVHNRQAIGRPFVGHNGEVTSVAYSPDGKRIVSGSRDQTVQIWEAQSGQRIGGALEGHKAKVTSVAFSEDGRFILSGGRDETLRIWDAFGDQSAGEPRRHPGRVINVAFSPDGSSSQSASWNEGLWLLNSNHSEVTKITTQNLIKPVLSVAFSRNGERMVTGSEDGSLQLWNAHTGKPTNSPMKGHTREVMSVAFNREGTVIVSGSGDTTIRLWDAETGAPIGAPMKGHEDSVTSVAFSPGGEHILSGSGDNTLRLWTAKKGKPIGQPLRGHGDGVTSVAFSPNGELIVSGSADNTIRLWDGTNGKSIGEPMHGHGDGIISVAFSPDGERIVSGSGDNTLRLWVTRSGDPIGGPMRGHQDGVTSVSFSHDGTYILSGSKDKTTRLWNAPEPRSETLCDKLTRNMSRDEWRTWVSPTIPSYTEQCPGLPISQDEQ